MEVIAIKGIRTESLRKFSKRWWPVHGVVKSHRGWLFLFVTGTDESTTVVRYAELISVEMKKMVIYVRGESGSVNQFTIYEHGIACPTSKTPGKHDSWLIENRLSLWKVSEEDQEHIRNLLCEFSDDTSGPIIYLDTSNSRLKRLAEALFSSWKLPLVWTMDSIAGLADDKDCEVI
ncbi:MAG: hypothetical protein JWR26_3563 [Pedosphaera sp.]|nr:hypothetical protein [Pedosphaera sp.]